MLLQGKCAIITGAGSGIGRASVLAYVENGANVIASDINQAGLDETLRQVSRKDAVRLQICDTSDASQVEALVKRCCDEFGRLDILFANAGIGGPVLPFFQMKPEDLERVFKVNVIGVFNCFKYASVQMMKQSEGGGSLIATASVAGVRSGAGDTAYSASKAAVISLCQTVANQLTGTNIRCNCINPGLVETGMTKELFDKADKHGSRGKVGQLNPMLRYGNSSEIASVAVFLGSEMSSYVNGQGLNVCGGLSSSHPVAGRSKTRISF